MAAASFLGDLTPFVMGSVMDELIPETLSGPSAAEKMRSRSCTWFCKRHARGGASNVCGDTPNCIVFIGIEFGLDYAKRRFMST